MRGNVMVEEAISKGKVKLVYLPMILIILFIGLGVYLKTIELIEDWMIAVFVVVGFILAWLTWSYFVVEWKIWAFENVRNVHDLKRKAIQRNLIWKDDSWFNKTEIINYEQKQKLKLLERKFLEKDVYHDDITIPKETLIHYSKVSIAFGIGFGTVFLATGIYFFTENSKEYYYLFFLGLSIYFFYFSIAKLINNQPQISINSKGIQLYKSTLMEWEFIDSEYVENRRSGKHVNYYLVFKFRNKYQEYLIDELAITPEKLEQLVRVYRVRFEKNNL
jgi:hypothetical protein